MTPMAGKKPAVAVAAVLAGLLWATGAGAAGAAGAGIFDKHCAHCHAPGADRPGTVQLGATRGEDFAVLRERTDLHPDYVKTIVRQGLNAMPPFKPTVITDADLERLADYLAGTE